MAEFAQGGLIPGLRPADGTLPIPLRHGCALVPAPLLERYGAEFFARLTGCSAAEVVAVHE